MKLKKWTRASRWRTSLFPLAVAFICHSAVGEELASPRALGADLPRYEAPQDPAAKVLEHAAPTGDLTLRDALAAALLRNPDLASLSWEMRSREARALQANARPNPTLGVEVEDFAGSGERRGFESSQTTISLGQLVELGGKRAKRTRVAELETALASWDYETARVALLSDTAKAFLRVLALQANADLFDELESLSQESVRSVSSTVKAGAVSPIEEDRALVTLERVQLEATRAAKELDAARALLSAAWGDALPEFSRAVGDLASVPAPPDREQLASGINENPEIARWNVEVQEREASLALERARRVPDVTAAVGPRFYGDENDVALVAQLSIPLPFFDRNRGSILDARYRLARASTEKRRAEVSVRSQVEAAYAELEAAYSEIQTLQKHIIPRATRVFTETRRGYATGLFRYVEVLDAQRTLFEAKRELLGAFAAYHLVATELERLTATPLDHLPNPQRP